jgi:hypothetical protein
MHFDFKRNHFNQTSSMTDLDKAILMHSESLSLDPTNHPDRSMSFLNVIIALQDRFSQTSSIADLDEAISLRES